MNWKLLLEALNSQTLCLSCYNKFKRGHFGVGGGCCNFFLSIFLSFQVVFIINATSGKVRLLPPPLGRWPDGGDGLGVRLFNLTRLYLFRRNKCKIRIKLGPSRPRGGAPPTFYFFCLFFLPFRDVFILGEINATSEKVRPRWKGADPRNSTIL